MELLNKSPQLMSAPPHIISCIVMLLISFTAGRCKERGYHISLGALIGIIGYTLLLYLNKYGSTVLYGAACTACIGSYSTIPLIMSWITNNIGGYTKRIVAIGLIIGFGNISGIVVGHVSMD